MKDMPCLSCVNWERKQEGPIAWHHACKLKLPGFPNRGEENCAEYSREPGSDDEYNGLDKRLAVASLI